jgi:hypothetical protein
MTIARENAQDHHDDEDFDERKGRRPGGSGGAAAHWSFDSDVPHKKTCP